MNERLVKAIADVDRVALGFAASSDPFQEESGESMDVLIKAVKRLRAVALATGMPEALVDKIALDEL